MFKIKYRTYNEDCSRWGKWRLFEACNNKSEMLDRLAREIDSDRTTDTQYEYRIFEGFTPVEVEWRELPYEVETKVTLV